MKLFSSLLFRLVVALALGIVVGLAVGPTVIQIIATVQGLLSQLIMFCIPLIILGFVALQYQKWEQMRQNCLGLRFLQPTFQVSERPCSPRSAVTG